MRVVVDRLTPAERPRAASRSPRILQFATTAALIFGGFSAADASKPTWPAEGLSLVHRIEERRLVTTSEDWKAHEDRVRRAKGVSKLDQLAELVLYSFPNEDIGLYKRRMAVFLSAIETQNSEFHRRTAALMQTYASAMFDNDYEGARRSMQTQLAEQGLDGTQLVLAHLLTAVLDDRSGDVSAALAHLRTAESLARIHEVRPAVKAQLASVHALILLTAREYVGFVRSLQEELLLCEKHEDVPCSGFNALYNLTGAFLDIGDIDGAAASEAAFGRLARRLGRPVQRFFAEHLCIRLAKEQADTKRQVACSRRAIALVDLAPEREVRLRLGLVEALIDMESFDEAHQELMALRSSPRFLADTATHERAELAQIDIWSAAGKQNQAYAALRRLHRTALDSRDTKLSETAAELRKLTDAESLRLRERASLLDAQSRLQQAVIDRQRIIGWLGAMVVLGVMFFALQLLISRRNLEAARNDALAASHAKSQFLANMSHEIRTPMYGVLGMAELLQSTALDERQKSYLETIHSSGWSLLTVINDVLDFSKIEAGKMVLDPTPCSLRGLTEDVAALLSMRARDKGLELIVWLQDDLPDGVMVDGGRIRQVLMNLVGNAIKFTEQGYVLIEVRGNHDNANNAVDLTFNVTDTGVGIPKDKQSLVFEEFTQAEGSTSRRFGGTGLGLSIVASLVKMMGGTVTVQSEAGEGAKFTIQLTLPVAAQGDLREESLVPSAGARVLIVDDLAVNATILDEQLSALGLRVGSASSAASGFDTLQTAIREGDPYDLLVLDYQMPEMDGLTLLQMLRDEPAFKALPIVMLSSVNDDGLAGICRALGRTDYLLKPVRSSVLCTAIARLITPEPTDAAAPPAREATDARVTSDPDVVGPARILVAEDNPVNRRILSSMMSWDNCHVDLVEDGEQAVTAFCREPYDLVMMDISMPNMDGIEATRAIRRWEEQTGRGRIPVIALTAHAMDGDTARFLSAGMDDHLTKPIRRAELREAVMQALQQPRP